MSVRSIPKRTMPAAVRLRIKPEAEASGVLFPPILSLTFLRIEGNFYTNGKLFKRFDHKLQMTGFKAVASAVFIYYHIEYRK